VYYLHSFEQHLKSKKMKIGKLMILSVALLVGTIGFAQKIMVTEGVWSVLKGQKKVNIEYDYSAMEVGDFASEEDYKKKKIKEYNGKEKGRGDKWEQSWERDKSVRYPEKFEELINKGMASNGISFAQNLTDAKYTLIVKTKFIEPGFNVGVASKPAAVSFEYFIVETADKSSMVVKASQKFVPGANAMGMDFDTGGRIAESYAKGGKMLAADMKKAMK
jgi:hypothetical protein